MTARLAVLAALVPAAALAHEGPAGHAHPHGVELLLFGAFSAVVVWLAARSLRDRP